MNRIAIPKDFFGEDCTKAARMSDYILALYQDAQIHLGIGAVVGGAILKNIHNITLRTGQFTKSCFSACLHVGRAPLPNHDRDESFKHCEPDDD